MSAVPARPFGCASIAMAILAAFASASAYQIHLRIVEATSWRTAPGVVTHVRLYEKRSSRGTNKAYGDISYSAGGQQITFTQFFGSSTEYQKGDKVTVRYSPASPEEANVAGVLEESFESDALKAMATGLVALIAGVVWLALHWRR